MVKKILLVLVVMLMATYAATAAKPTNTCVTIQDGTLMTSGGIPIPMGFMDNGYNYQAHLYNGLYGEDKLVMKWSDEWLSNKDCDDDGLLDRHYGFDSYIGSGAWLTNHWTGSYEGDVYHWDVSGTWLLDFAGGTDNREFVNLVQDADGNVVGEFWYLSGSDWLYGGTLVGTVSGDNLHLDYDRAPILYTGTFDGVIGDNVITGGTFSDSAGNDLTWTATGTSVKVYDVCYWNDFIKIVAVPTDAYLDTGYWYTADGVLIGESIWGEFAIIQEVWNDPCAEYSGLYVRGDAPSGFGFYKP